MDIKVYDVWLVRYFFPLSWVLVIKIYCDETENVCGGVSNQQNIGDSVTIVSVFC